MRHKQHNQSPARRSKRCALSLLAGFSLVAGGLYLAQADHADETLQEYVKTVATDARSSTVRYQSSN